MTGRVIPPGSTIGVLGSGQLGRMFAIAARQLGYRVHVLSPDNDTPTGQVADVEWNADYLDLSAVAEFARSVQVVTFEFENIPVETTRLVEREVAVHPAGSVLHTTQHRGREKEFLSSRGIAIAPYRLLRSEADVVAAAAEDSCPGVLKTTAWGYDGKGQVTIDHPDQALSAWRQLDGQEAVWERFIDFEAELSVVAARGSDGRCVVYPPTLNTHRKHILDISVSPAGIPDRLVQEAHTIAREVLESLEVIGVLCVEFFLTKEGRLLVNEIAPRPHNSGHLTIDAHATCQFEQQVRAVCGLPLGSVRSWSPAAMANLLGDEWMTGPPDWPSLLAERQVKLHLYGKREPRLGRKMGHLTALAETSDEAVAIVTRARQRLHI